LQLTQADAVALVAAGLGAFLGSGSAFLLQFLHQRRDLREGRESALVQAEFILSMQMNTLVQLRKQYLSPLTDDPNRTLSLRPAAFIPTETSLDMTAIAFVAVLGPVEALQAVHSAQDAYRNALALLRERSDLYKQICYSPDVESSSFDFDSGESVSRLDARQVRVLQSLTDGLYKTVDAAIELETQAFGALDTVIRRQYPKANRLYIEVADA
jgi:hypothetical protein